MAWATHGALKWRLTAGFYRPVNCSNAYLFWGAATVRSLF